MLSKCKSCGKDIKGIKYQSSYCDGCADDIVNDKELRDINLRKQYARINEEAEEADRQYENRNVRGRI